MYRIKAIFSNVQLLKRIGITLALLFLFRITTWIPIPLLDTSSITDFVASNGFLAILNNFTGNALGRFSIMAMGISPYITASIVIQLLQMDIARNIIFFTSKIFFPVKSKTFCCSARVVTKNTISPFFIKS